MKSVGIRSLKNRLSEYVRLAQQGEEILVTSHGQVVAELHPPSEHRPGMLHPGIAEMVRLGVATLGKPNAASLYPKLGPSLTSTTSQSLLDDERGDR